MSFLALAVHASLVAGTLGFRPVSVLFTDLASNHGSIHNDTSTLALKEALTGEGIVAIANIPGYEPLRSAVLEGAHTCLQLLTEKDARNHTFEDGTLRRTLAMAISATGTVDPPHGGVSACLALREKLTAFRVLISRVAIVFASSLSTLLDLEQPLLVSSSAEVPAYKNVEDIFQRGEQLEHVHAYRRSISGSKGTIETKAATRTAATSPSSAATVDFHTDQGICLAFTAPLMVEIVQGNLRTRDWPVGEFWLRLRSGEEMMVELPSDQLFFVLGDGVNQYVNRKKRSGLDLRAAPHALVIPSYGGDSRWRLWYGRMFLPPSDALYDVEHGVTFGELQRALQETWTLAGNKDNAGLTVGCSKGHSVHELRQLSGVPSSGGCASNQMQCWFRCMNYTPAANPASCAAQGNAVVKCTNRRDEVSNGYHHGDYAPRCTNSTQPVRASCSLPQVNANRPARATASGFEAFLARQGSFTGRHDLLLDVQGAPEVVFAWRIANDLVNGTAAIEGVLAFNGQVSWMAWGLENQGGYHNGMNGGVVVMGISSQDAEYPSLLGVHEYRIHDRSSGFDFWKTPYATPATCNALVVSEGGYTAMHFKTNSIYGLPLNIMSGPNRLIWAIRASSYMHVGKDSYHEGCRGGTRVRYRGGGQLNPWVVDFTDNIHRVVDPSAANQGNHGNQGSNEHKMSGLRGRELPRLAMLPATLLAASNMMLG